MRTMLTFKCECCGCEFKRIKEGKHFRFCSRSCANKKTKEDDVGTDALIHEAHQRRKERERRRQEELSLRERLRRETQQIRWGN